MRIKLLFGHLDFRQKLNWMVVSRRVGGMQANIDTDGDCGSNDLVNQKEVEGLTS